MRTLDNYIGIQPFLVPVEDTPQLKALAEQARQLKNLPFSEKLEAVKKIALGAMVNAYEEWRSNPDSEEAERYGDIVMRGHSLGYALEHKAGCCRYQGALFFVLGYEAELGDKHFVQSAEINPQLSTVFNDVINEGNLSHVSIFIESVRDKRYDYTQGNKEIFDRPQEFDDLDFYSYHRTPNGLILACEKGKHVRDIN
ncbi:hypothetical protein KY366_00245 [Candidatus Woesearchaeota archaeon]|nr:hypothetical protein [Candidatus Woesearchaeota archaeon]